jgi:hypothetical protein
VASNGTTAKVCVPDLGKLADAMTSWRFAAPPMILFNIFVICICPTYFYLWIAILRIERLKFFSTLIKHKAWLKGSLQWEPRGVREVAYIRNRPQTVAIEVCLPFNLAIVFDFTYFRFRPSKAKWIGNVLPNRRNAPIRSMFFFLLYNAHCLLAQRVSLRS